MSLNLIIASAVDTFVVIAHSYGTLIIHFASKSDGLFNHTALIGKRTKE